LSEGVTVSSGGSIKIELNHQDLVNIPVGWDLQKPDNRILAVAYHLMHECQEPVYLVTKDLSLRVKADVLGIPSQDYYKDKVNYPLLYEGIRTIESTKEQIDQFFKEGRLPLGSAIEGYPHQFFILKGMGNSSQSALGRCVKDAIVPLKNSEVVSFGVRARNKEQKFALEVLLDDEVKVVTLVGCAGTGKTLLALAVGLEKVLEQNKYSRLLVTRPIVPMGHDIGYLPGSKEEKLRPWMQPIFDNLDYLFCNQQDPLNITDHLIERGFLEIEALTYIRGRSIPKQFILCDEAQNLSPHMIKTVITRVGEGSKIVFTGDPEQIDHPYLDSNSNGLSYLAEKLKSEELAGHVVLSKGERSEVAELSAQLL
ncbi:MAG TPA: PhoH family protein, partial [Syntrophales bacterium]|nr:PhoH family protein [Syntrophales bacterium]